jgi:hypothetical protein
VDDQVAMLALKDRICDATDRIPTSRWPFYSTTIEGDIPAADTENVFTFEAERDTLFTDLCISVQSGDPLADIEADISIEYCNVQYADHTDVQEFSCCCQRKLIFLVGVRENKRLRFTINTAALALPKHVRITLSGFQGDGCCS